MVEGGYVEFEIRTAVIKATKPAVAVLSKFFKGDLPDDAVHNVTMLHIIAQIIYCPVRVRCTHFLPPRTLINIT